MLSLSCLCLLSTKNSARATEASDCEFVEGVNEWIVKTAENSERASKYGLPEYNDKFMPCISLLGLTKQITTNSVA